MVLVSTTAVERMAASVSERFRTRYGAVPRVFLAPGRVNLIGEHTDYNDGFVMPVAIDSYVWVAVSGRGDPILSVYSEHFGESVQLRLASLSGPPRKHWSDYVRGVAALLQATDHIVSGVNLLIYSRVPLGAGLSSSAALEVSTALALAAASNQKIPQAELVKLCQRAEHEYAGTRCGIMDQFVAVFGRSQSALMLDCRSLEYAHLPIPEQVRIVICNSMVKHELAAGEYNRRREDCESGVARLKSRMTHIRALRDVTLADLDENKDILPEQVFRRCRHVVSENQRVLQAADALRSGNLASFGELMYESHASLRNDYEVSCEELDLLVELARKCDGTYGARMTGGGFGGCTVNLVDREAVGAFQTRVAEQYKQATGRAAEIYVSEAAEGARAWSTGDGG